MQAVAHQPSPLYPILNEINIAAQNGLSLLAISMCVTLPDICVSLASPNGRNDGNGKRGNENYKDWCREHLGKKFAALSPEDLYSLRCGVLHNGRFGDLKGTTHGRVIFCPAGSEITFVDCSVNDAYFYSVVDFCKNFTDAVFAWLEKHRSDATIQANLDRLIQYRQHGLAPYVNGLPILA